MSGLLNEQVNIIMQGATATPNDPMLLGDPHTCPAHTGHNVEALASVNNSLYTPEETLA